jgi:hypothetical protein
MNMWLAALSVEVGPIPVAGGGSSAIGSIAVSYRLILLYLYYFKTTPTEHNIRTQERAKPRPEAAT